jgi:hypothetical protein
VTAAEYYQAALHRAVGELVKAGDEAKIGCIARVLQDLVEGAYRLGRDHA